MATIFGRHIQNQSANVFLFIDFTIEGHFSITFESIFSLFLRSKMADPRWWPLKLDHSLSHNSVVKVLEKSCAIVASRHHV